MPSLSELPFIGRNDSTRNVNSAPTGLSNHHIQEIDGKALRLRRKDDAKTPLQRAFEIITNDKNAATHKLTYTPYKHSNVLQHAVNGGSRQILLNGSYLLFGVQSTEGKGTNVWYDKHDVTLP